jgi:hypothetical protein
MKFVSIVTNDIKCVIQKNNMSIKGSLAKRGINNPMFGKKRPEHSKKMKGQNNPNYKGNKALYKQKHFCIDCRGELKSVYIKTIRCYSCSQKHKIKFNYNGFKGNSNPMFNKKHSINTKRKISLSHGGTGISYENNKYPEEFYRIRYWILKKDNYICQLCFKYANEVHHIDYNKQNNNKENLICLCHKCNMKVNKNRDFWKKILRRLCDR